MKEREGRWGVREDNPTDINNSFRILKKVTFLTREGPLEASALLPSIHWEAYLMLLSAQDC